MKCNQGASVIAVFSHICNIIPCFMELSSRMIRRCTMYEAVSRGEKQQDVHVPKYLVLTFQL
jgi:hypothetical protein